MRNGILIIILNLLTQVSFAQTDYPSELAKLREANDTISQQKLLQRWEKHNPDDPELYTNYFNYYLNKSRKEILVLTTEQPKGEAIAFQDSLNHTAGYMSTQVNYDEALFNKAIAYLNKGIKRFPDRLDMRFGKIYVFGLRENWEEFTNEIVKAIEYSNINKNKWLWTNNEPVEDPKDFFLGDIQHYILQLYYTENNDLLINMRKIAETVLKYYPNNIENLTNLSITYLLNDEYDKALKPLLKAEKLNPKNFIVIQNIAQVHKLKGDKKTAIKYYEKLLKYGDESSKQYAREQLEELKK